MSLRTWERIRDAWWLPRWVRDIARDECNEWYESLEGLYDEYT